MDFTLSNILIIALILIVISLVVWLWLMNQRINRLFTGRQGQSLEELAENYGQELKALHASRQEIERFLIQADARLATSVRHVRTLRYNPFPDQGGSQSFTTALLDEKGNGVILTGLHARDTMRVYAKPIRAHTSEIELTQEERSALAYEKV